MPNLGRHAQSKIIRFGLGYIDANKLGIASGQQAEERSVPRQQSPPTFPPTVPGMAPDDILSARAVTPRHIEARVRLPTRRRAGGRPMHHWAAHPCTPMLHPPRITPSTPLSPPGAPPPTQMPRHTLTRYDGLLGTVLGRLDVRLLGLFRLLVMVEKAGAH